jgi:hypothetical protein
MKTQYKPIAMRCTKPQFDSIKDKINLPIIDIDNFKDFKDYPYLVNNCVCGGKRVSNKKMTLCGVVEIIETFNAEYFLDCCGRERPDEEVIFDGSKMQYRTKEYIQWRNCAEGLEYRITPKPNLNSDIEALHEKAKSLGLKVTVIIE